MTSQNLFELRELTEARIKAFQDHFNQQTQIKKYSPETIGTYFRGIKRFLEYLEKTHQILMNPSDALEMPRHMWRYRTIKETLTEKEIQKMIECWDETSWKGIRARAILELLYSTGLRMFELVNLNLDDVDERTGYVRVRGGKGAKDRIQPLGRTACQILKKYLKEARPKLVHDPKERAFFLDYARGKRLQRWRMDDILKESAQKAKITKKPSAHMIRRSFATHLLRNDAHPYYVKELLGHSSLRTTGKYIKVAGIDLKKAHSKYHPREKHNVAHR